MSRLLTALAAIVLTLFALTDAEAFDHAIYLPNVPNTPLMQQVIAHQDYTWCADSKADAYPNFVTQLQDVEDQYAASAGIHATQVAYGAGCQVRHEMAPAFPCGAGAAACITYANVVVEVFYNYYLGYTDWRSAQGHELGHGLLGLHERYIDSGGTIKCGGPEIGLTVMDCGPPYVRYPTTLDVQRGCAIILTSWCGTPYVPPATWCCDTVYPGWEGMGVSRLYLPTLEWFWGIPQKNGAEFLYKWSGNGPWKCTSGCP